MSDTAIFVTQRLRTYLEPTILAIRPAEAIDVFVGSLFFNAGTPLPQRGIAVIKMNKLAPTPLCRIVRRDTRVLHNALIHIVQLSAWCSAKYKRRYGVDDLPKVVLTLAQCLLNPFLIVDVGQKAIPPKDVSIVITQWLCPYLEPAILAIRAAMTIGRFKHLS